MRRQVNELTFSDLDAFPIWEYALAEEGDDDADECTVRPRTNLIDFWEDPSAVSHVVVKTEFMCTGEAAYLGLCTPSVDGDVVAMNPVIITPSGHVSLILGWVKFPDREIAEGCRRLGIAPERLFPIRFRSTVPTPGYISEGVISAFEYNR